MEDTAEVIEARRDVYRITSLALFAIVLVMLLLGISELVKFAYVSEEIRMYADLGKGLPFISRYLLTWNPIAYQLAAGLLCMLLIVKEILAAPIARFWINFVAMVVLLICEACWFLAVSLPMWDMVQGVHIG